MYFKNKAKGMWDLRERVKREMAEVLIKQLALNCKISVDLRKNICWHHLTFWCCFYYRLPRVRRSRYHKAKFKEPFLEK